MPMYLYECKKCKQEVTIIRRFTEIEDPLSDEETSQVAEHNCQPHDWHRVLGPVSVHKAPGFGSKGHW